jgi:hypothetical protein
MAKRKRTKEQTTQWPKEKGQKNRQHNGQKKKDKQRSTKHTYKTKDPVTQTPLRKAIIMDSNLQP